MTVSTESEVALDEGGAERVSSVEPAQAARVSGGVLCSYRASLVECGRWAPVRLALAERLGCDPRELDEVTPGDWLDLDSFSALLDAQLVCFDLETLKTLMRRRIAAPSISSNFLGPVLRSWARSFGTSPEHMLRGLVPLWRAALRHAGSPEPVVVAAGEVHVLVRGPLVKPLLASPALAASFEGLLLGLLDLAQPRPMLAEVELQATCDGLTAICRF